MYAKYNGVCKISGRKINKGDLITKVSGGYALQAMTKQGEQYDKYQSHIYRFNSGAEVYVNKRGRCEDAPCCGCCS